jgi:peptidyl-prolyl cis-trans isomerase D
MLLQFRNITRGWVATIILGLVALAMVIFLVPNNGLNMAGGNAIATVGGRSITAAQLSRELDIELRQARSQGATVTQQDAVDQGLHLQLLERLIGRRAIDAYAEKVGVSASNTMVANFIRQMPPVLNPVTGNFDEAAYDNLLNQLNFSRVEFEEEIRGDITRQMVLEPLLAGVRAPSSFGAAALAYEAETRVVTLAEAPASAAGTIPNPTEAQLQMFWEESQEQLRVPEFRALTLVYARPQEFIARVNVPETRLREEFEAQRARLTQPERRSYVRIAAQNEAQATQAAQRLGRGEDAQAIATALGLQLTRGDNTPRNEITDSGVAEAVFSMQARQARAVRGQLTPWVAVRVENITPAQAPDFAAIRDDLRHAIAADEASELMNQAVTVFEDARGGGASAADAGRQAGLTVVSIPAVEAGGRDTSGAEIETLHDQEEVLRTAFETPEGEASDFIPIGEDQAGDTAVVSVDSITPATVRPLDDVRDQLRQVWLARERGRRLRELGDEVIAAVAGGQAFQAAARARGFRIVPPASQPIDRRTAQRALPRGLSEEIFTASEGGVVSEMSPDGGALLLVTVERINRIDPATMPQQVEAVRGQMQEGLAGSFGMAVQAEVIQRANVSRNERLLNATFRQTGAEEEDQAQ